MKTLFRQEFSLANKVMIIHVLCWLGFIIYELTSLYYLSSKLDSVFSYILYYSVNISFFYMYIHLLNITLRFKRINYIIGAVLIIALFMATLLIKLVLISVHQSDQFSFLEPAKRFKATVVSALYRTGLFSLLATFYWSAEQIGYYRNQSLKAERDRLNARQETMVTKVRLAETRNAYLQQQINPHMLFNTLNFIYNSVDKRDPEAAKSVHLLAEIMRFSLEAAGEDGKTSLKEEMAQIHNLVEINKRRYDQPLHLDMTISGDFSQYQIIPLILFSLTENIFKHGNLRSKAGTAVLSISVSAQGELRYYSKNLKRAATGFKRDSSIGIRNIRTRMDYSYPDKYQLLLTDHGDVFETDLTLSL